MSTLSPTLVRKRYFREFAVGLAIYVAGVVLAAGLVDDGDSVTGLHVALMSVPVIGLLVMVAAMWRYFGAVDEVLRAGYSQALLVAAFAVLAISGAWGLMELMSESVPRLPVFFVFPIFMGVFGMASGLRRRLG